jgi:hypothetical protein
MRISRVASRKAQLLLLQSLAEPLAPAGASEPPPQTLHCRDQSLAILRHFLELASDPGRLPSLMGREFFRARVSPRGIPSFEDQIVFLCDVERCLSRLSHDQAEIVALKGLYDLPYHDVAQLLRCSQATAYRRFSEALDALSEAFLQARLLRRPPLSL